ncbi:hypothetical protein LC087_02165 [Bacillus carboniphilus]|uniref:PH domain-containing protein n=1 Tax=Bacillus carboniphilus TaxID=86663 RepID=A0ABY9JUI0_9BACI|nr:hypothetical protein [Bacillus carboniphilus]WLR43045.1 hypothetical protein LC087_02165 [Bacillus carboniphilus]
MKMTSEQAKKLNELKQQLMNASTSEEVKNWSQAIQEFIDNIDKHSDEKEVVFHFRNNDFFELKDKMMNATDPEEAAKYEQRIHQFIENLEKRRVSN